MTKNQKYIGCEVGRGLIWFRLALLLHSSWGGMQYEYSFEFFVTAVLSENCAAIKSKMEFVESDSF